MPPILCRDSIRRCLLHSLVSPSHNSLESMGHQSGEDRKDDGTTDRGGGDGEWHATRLNDHGEDFERKKSGGVDGEGSWDAPQNSRWFESVCLMFYVEDGSKLRAEI